MKTRANWLLVIPVVTLGLGACNKPEETKVPETPAAVAEKPTIPGVPAVVPPVPAAILPKIGVAERAAKLGFAQHLPQDTEAVIAYYDGTKTAERVKNSRLWSLVQGQMGGSPDMLVPQIEPGDDGQEKEIPEAGQQPPAGAGAIPRVVPPPADEELVGPAALFGTEFTLALGKTSGEQASHLLTLDRRMVYFQMRNIAKAFSAAVKSGDASSFESSVSEGYSGDLAKELLKDPQSGLALFEKSHMPPIYMAFRTTETGRPAAAQQITSLIGDLEGFAGPMLEPVSVDVSGHPFTGSKILGAKIAEEMAKDRESMEADLDPATVDQIIAAVAKKDLVIVSGTVGDYVVLFVGASVDDLKLAADPAQSLVGNDALAFSDAYASKELAAVVYGQNQALDELVAASPGISDVTSGLRDGLSGSGGLGDTRDLEAMFQIVAEREAALRKLATTEALGTVAFFEEGLKIETFGGSDNGMVAWKTPNKLGHLGTPEDVVMFADLTTDAAYDEKAHAYVEALMETGYAIAMKVSESPVDGGQIGQFKEMTKMFDTKFRTDLVALWDALSEDFKGSLGQERALVVDLKGGAPAVPNVPQKVLDKAKIPRITLISPVTDRAKLSASWDKMNTTLTGTLAKVSEMAGTEIPMQKPMSSERSGNTTWFFPMPFLTDDFVPSVTVSDKWFAASTSKNQALDLVAKADAGGAEAATGVWFTLNFKTLQKYSDEMLKVYEDNAEAMTGSPLSATDKKSIQDGISLLGGLDKLTVHTRREESGLRTSVHFKTR